VLIQFPQSINKENQQKYFSTQDLMVLFRNYFTKVTSQHVGNECNSTHLIQCGRVDFKTIEGVSAKPC